MLPMPSSVILASICRSTGRTSAAVDGPDETEFAYIQVTNKFTAITVPFAKKHKEEICHCLLIISNKSTWVEESCVLLSGEAGLDLGVVTARWLRPLRKRRNDSRKDFLKDFRRDMGWSPTPDISLGFNVHFAATSLWRIYTNQINKWGIPTSWMSQYISLLLNKNMNKALKNNYKNRAIRNCNHHLSGIRLFLFL